MSLLKKLNDAASLKDLAALLGYSASSVAFLIYKMPVEIRYTRFLIPKKNGGIREINAPNPALKDLQRRLANILSACNWEIESTYQSQQVAHAFRPEHSIITNARRHKKRRYVLNIDLLDYFPSYNFGRVRGYFIKNEHFKLNEKVATIIAQIACHDNMLPQGSPCSPIISELISHILDVRLLQLAKETKATYSRYADDITFSINNKQFPALLATITPPPEFNCILSNTLVNQISKCGFNINSSKIRMQSRTNRQLVTGLTVNSKVNIKPEYYKTTRAMCHSLFKRGEYYLPNNIANVALQNNGSEIAKQLINKLDPLAGRLGFIHHVKDTIDLRNELDKKKDLSSARKLYQSFLIYRYFVRLEQPLIICEGKTDMIYLKAAIKKLTQFHPKLGVPSGSGFKSNLSFMNYTNKVHNIIQVSGGTGELKHLILNYKKHLSQFEHKPLKFPVILLIDNDDGAKDIFGVLKEKGITANLNTTDDYYKITDNLYLIKTPELGNNSFSYIEKLFDNELLNIKYNGKRFNPSNQISIETEYGKAIFSEMIIKPNIDKINFNNFVPLLKRIEKVIEDYKPPLTIQNTLNLPIVS